MPREAHDVSEQSPPHADVPLTRTLSPAKRGRGMSWSSLPTQDPEEPFFNAEVRDALRRIRAPGRLPAQAGKGRHPDQCPQPGAGWRNKRESRIIRAAPTCLPCPAQAGAQKARAGAMPVAIATNVCHVNPATEDRSAKSQETTPDPFFLSLSCASAHLSVQTYLLPSLLQSCSTILGYYGLFHCCFLFEDSISPSILVCKRQRRFHVRTGSRPFSIENLLKQHGISCTGHNLPLEYCVVLRRGEGRTLSRVRGWGKRKGVGSLYCFGKSGEKAVYLKTTPDPFSAPCGFRNRERFRNAILFHLGGLDLYPAGVSATHTTS